MNEKEMNLAIYNKLADIAREVFNHVICEPGTYSVADVAKHIHTAETSERVRKVCADGVTREVNEPLIARSFINGFYWAEDYDPAKDTHAVEVEGFACKVNGWGVFLVLQKAATAWAIPTAARPVFTRKAETADPAEVAATFAVNKELRDLAAIVDPREKLRPVYTYICIDTRRRAAVACNGFTLRVVALPDLLTAPGAADSYLIAPALLKSGKGRVTITADGYASNGATVAPLGNGRFPNWAGLVSSTLSNYNYSEAARVELSRPTFNALKKSVKAAAKLSERVTIAAQSYDTAATVYAHDIDHDRDHESRAELAAPARSSFNVVLRADQFAKLADVTAFYIVSNAAPVLAAASLGFYYFNPLLAEDGEKYYTPFNVAPAGAMYNPLSDFAEVAAPAADNIETPATADSIESEAETITDTPAEVAAPAADLTADTDEPTPAPAADSIETPAAETITPDTMAPATADSEADTLAPDELAEVAAPAALTAAAALLTLAEVRDAAKAIAKAKTADDYDSQRAARDARRLLTTAHGLTVSDYKIKTADGLTLTRFIYTYGKKSRRTLCAPLLKAAAEFATLESLAAEWAELTAAAAADSIESEGTGTPAPAADSIESQTAEPTPAETIESETPAAEVAAPAADLTAESEAETIEADPLPLLSIDTAAGVIVWGLADELPTADGVTADTVTPADLLTIEADTLTADTLAGARLLLTADSQADTLAAEVATLETPREITADTDSEADTITTDEPTDDTDPATADSESDSTTTDTTTSGHPHAHGSTPATMATPCSPSAPLAPVAPVLI